MFYFAKHSWTGSIGSQDTHITKSLLRNQREAGAWCLWDQTVSPKTSCHNNSPRFLQRVAIYKTLLHPLPHVILLTTKYLGWGLTSTSLSIEQTTFVYCCVADNMVSSGNTRMECKSKSLSSRAPSVVGEWVHEWFQCRVINALMEYTVIDFAPADWGRCHLSWVLEFAKQRKSENILGRTQYVQRHTDIKDLAFWSVGCIGWG